jgi:hypothetical protein
MEEKQLIIEQHSRPGPSCFGIAAMDRNKSPGGVTQRCSGELRLGFGAPRNSLMLRFLRQSDIDAILAACNPAGGNGLEGDARRERLYDLIEALPQGAQEELLALMWTGGPRNHASFAENLELAQKTREENHASHIAEQHGRLAEYLTSGLTAAGVQETGNAMGR